MIFSHLQRQAAELQTLIASLHSRLKQSPEGSLRLSTKGPKYRYYQHLSADCEHPSSQNLYIPKGNVDLAAMLAQKDYDQQLYKAACRQLDSIQQFLTDYDPDALVAVYQNLHPVRKTMVDPRIPIPHLYMQQWKEQVFEGLSFTPGVPEIYSQQGERVRSKSEKILADLFTQYEIPYRYECPLILPGFGTVYPDFTLLNPRNRKECIWEHLGMMDDPEYCSKALTKINRYTNCGYIPGKNLILTYESRSCPLNTRTVERLIQEYLL